jgi:hypothetical protein
MHNCRKFRRAPLTILRSTVQGMLLGVVATGSLGAGCPALHDTTPWKIRAVRGDGTWTGDIYFKTWPAYYTVILRWPHPTMLKVCQYGMKVDTRGSI